MDGFRSGGQEPALAGRRKPASYIRDRDGGESVARRNRASGAAATAGGSAGTSRRSGECRPRSAWSARSEEHTSELQSLMRISYAVFCLKKKRQENMRHSKMGET